MNFFMKAAASGGGSGTTFEQVRQQIIDNLTNPELWTHLLFIIVKIIVIFIAGRLIVKIANKALGHMMIERDKSPLKFDMRRTKTIGKLIGNIITYVVNFIMILMILVELGIEMGPLLASAGVVGLAIGFGAQSLVKDVITGFFIIFEDQFAVGDVIQVGTYKGTVEEIGLRITKIRSWTGEVFIIPNGTISQVTNFSIHNSLAIVDIRIAYEENIDKAIKVLKETALAHYETNEDIVKEPEVLGVHMLGPTEVTLRVTAECKPNTHIPVVRKLYAEFKGALEASGIEIPYPRLVTYHRSEAEDSWKRSSTN